MLGRGYGTDLGPWGGACSARDVHGASLLLIFHELWLPASCSTTTKR